MGEIQPTSEQLGLAVRAARQKSGKYQEEAAQTLGVSRVAISNYERGMVPEDFITGGKLSALATLYGVTASEIVANAQRLSAELSEDRIPEDEPIADHIAKFPVAVQVWFHAFLSELMQLALRDNVKASMVERARDQITLGNVDFWAGGDLFVQESNRTLAALRQCAEAAWRNVTEPGWLHKPQSEWRTLPPIFWSGLPATLRAQSTQGGDARNAMSSAPASPSGNPPKGFRSRRQHG